MKKQWIRATVAIGALALAAAACGSSSNDSTDTPAADEAPSGEELPVVDSPDGGEPADDPAVEPACLPDEPQCEDMVVSEDDEMPVPDEGDSDAAGGTVPSGMAMDGGLTVSEALATDSTGILAVQGHYFDDGSGPTLCEALEGGGERYECGGPQIEIDSFDPGTVVADFIIHDGLTYTEAHLTLFGELNDGVLSVDSLVAG